MSALPDALPQDDGAHSDGRPRPTAVSGSVTYREIASQPRVWAEVLGDANRIERAAAWVRKESSRRVVIAGCGSSFHLASAAACAFNEMSRIPTLALPAGEAVTGWGQHVPPGESTLLVAVSRSGETSEVLWAIEEHRQRRRGPVLALTTVAGSSIVAASDEALVISAAAEESVLMTRSFSGMLLALDALAARLGDVDLSLYDAIPVACQAVLDAAGPVMGGLAVETAGLERIFVLGSGAAYGIAREGALKLLEGSLTPAQPFQHLEFRHGPKALASADTLVVSLATREADEFERTLVAELEGYGAKVLRSAPADDPGPRIPIPACPDAHSEALLHLPVLQLLTLHRAALRGLDPDEPRNLEAVVQLARSRPEELPA